MTALLNFGLLVHNAYIRKEKDASFFHTASQYNGRTAKFLPVENRHVAELLSVTTEPERIVILLAWKQLGSPAHVFQVNDTSLKHVTDFRLGKLISVSAALYNSLYIGPILFLLAKHQFLLFICTLRSNRTFLQILSRALNILKRG